MKTTALASALAIGLAYGFSAAAPASAADASGKYAALGLGARTCADLMAAPKEVAMIVGVWVQGYMTAHNQVLPDTFDVSGGRADAQIEQEIFRACRGNDGMSIAEAARKAAAAMYDGRTKVASN